MSEDTGCKHDTTYKMPDQSVVCVTCLRRERDGAVDVMERYRRAWSGTDNKELDDAQEAFFDFLDKREEDAG